MRLPLALMLCFTTALSAAQELGQAALGSHEHGVATLDIAVDGNTVSIDLRAPGIDIVGFERAARDDTERAQLSAATIKLQDAASILGMAAAAACVPDSRDVHTHGFDAGAHDHDGHDHHEHDGPDKHAHGSFHAQHAYTCTNVAALRFDLAKYFAAFPSTESVRVQSVGATQKAAELTAENSVYTP